VGIKRLLSLYHETVDRLGWGNHKISFMVHRMERFNVECDDEKIGNSCAVID
jgi:hypothetical protein